MGVISSQGFLPDHCQECPSGQEDGRVKNDRGFEPEIKQQQSYEMTQDQG